MFRSGRFLFVPLLAFLSVAPQAHSSGIAVVNSMTVTNRSGAVQTNYPLQFGRPFLDGAIRNQPQVLINGSPVPTQADIKNRWPDGSVEFAVIAVMIPTLPANGSLTLSFADAAAAANAPLTQAQMLDPRYVFDAVINLVSGGFSKTVDARQMLQHGDYKLWTQGPIAQTIELADDTPTRKYDIGFDSFHPFRPRFFATFWPATHQVWVRYVGENGNSQELEDLAYNLTLTIGNRKAYSKPGLKHRALTVWTKTFWLGGTPAAQVDIDSNLAYLESTRFLPNFDTSIKIPESAIASEYAEWTGLPHDLYDGTLDGGLWQSAMGAAGAREEIAPYPQWTALWLYTGDWRMRQMALGMADLAGAFPGNLREGDPSKRLLRTDPKPVAPAIGSGYGRPTSVTDRKTSVYYALGDLLNYFYTAPADKVIVVGAVDVNSLWSYDGPHEPSPFYPQYILTGDPFYLAMMESWAGFDANLANGGSSFDFSRGPTGAEGGISDPAARGNAWPLRSRAEAAFAVPDGDPEKTYLTILTNEALSRWEGVFGVTGTAYDGTTQKLWGAQTGNPLADNGGPNTGKAPSLGNWDNFCNPATPGCIYVSPLETGGVLVPGTVGSLGDPWMNWYLQYALGRTAELGFAAAPLQQATIGKYLIGMINDSGHPMLTASYDIPVEKLGGGFLTWPELVATITPAYLTSPTCVAGVADINGSCSLTQYFTENLFSDGREVWATPGLAELVDQGAAGAAAAWAWWKPNVYDVANSPTYVPGTEGLPFNTDPKWAIVPRTDTNTLPAVPTAVPAVN